METIKTYDYPRVKIGYAYYPKLIEYLKDYDVTVVFLTKTNELLITDEIIIESLKKLEIPYERNTLTNSLRYIKDIV